MNLTNIHDLPDAMVRAVANDPYTKGGADISVTELISPVRQRALRERYNDAISEDAADRVWSLLGQAVHEILRRADADAITELRLDTTVDGWTLSGAFDRLLIFPDGLLQDYKVTSSWSVLDGAKVEWEQQLNIYAELVRQHGGDVDRLEIVAVLRDWSRARALASADYPQRMVEVVPVSLWSRDQARAFIDHRVAAHQAARELADDDLPPCTADERWERPSAWAHKREKRKSAVKLYDSQAAADAAVAMDDAKHRAYVEHRPGVSVRCADYCPVVAFCNQGRALTDTAGAIPLGGHQ